MENTKPQKSDYTKRHLKIKDVPETNPLDAEHRYLGDRGNVYRGYTPGGSIQSDVHYGTSKPLLKKAKGY